STIEVEAAMGAPLIPDCWRIAAEVTPSRGTKSRFFFSLIRGCTDSTGSVQERKGRLAHKLLARHSPYKQQRDQITLSPIGGTASLSLESITVVSPMVETCGRLIARKGDLEILLRANGFALSPDPC